MEQSAGTVIPVLAPQQPGGEPVAAAAGEAFASAIRVTSFAAVGFVTLGLLATLKLPPEGARRRDDEEERPGASIWPTTGLTLGCVVG